ncbi:11665_t:CDS:2 [Paraglomus brasilianum]|uniref:11665_t:CDS:1 n=1 Tax=Paraglomus brasilianum TaxID=144538 RepID=A0A9N9DID3_9GLOM|nr:11665_t:CDS:2 [Paraglomus brasilianum]
MINYSPLIVCYVCHVYTKALQKVFLSEKLQLPEKPLDESSPHCVIALNISMEKYNTFVESKESGSSLTIKRVYIVEMCLTEYGVVVDIIGKYFNALFPDMFSSTPIQILGRPRKPYARVILEVAMSQNFSDLRTIVGFGSNSCMYDLY